MSAGYGPGRPTRESNQTGTAPPEPSANTANTNCLEGIACSKCGALGPFRIVVSGWATVTDDGTDLVEDVSWEDDAPCRCGSCRHTGLVSDFKHLAAAALVRD